MSEVKSKVEYELAGGPPEDASTVMSLFAASGHYVGLYADRKQLLEEALFVVTAREVTKQQQLGETTGKLAAGGYVGIGIATSNPELEHAATFDIAVRRNLQEGDLGKLMCLIMLKLAEATGITDVAASPDSEIPVSSDREIPVSKRWFTEAGLDWSEPRQQLVLSASKPSPSSFRA